MQIRYREENQIHIFHLEGPFTQEKIKIIKPKVIPLLEMGPNTKVLFSFKQVTFVDSSGFGEMVTWAQRAKKIQCVLAFCEFLEPITKMLQIAKLDKYLTIYLTEADALQALQK